MFGVLPFGSMGMERIQICDACGARHVEQQAGSFGMHVGLPVIGTAEAEWGHLGNMMSSFDVCPTCLRKAYDFLGIKPAPSPLLGGRHLRPVPPMPSPMAPMPMPVSFYDGAGLVRPAEETAEPGLSPDDLRELARNGSITADDLRELGIDIPDPPIAG